MVLIRLKKTHNARRKKHAKTNHKKHKINKSRRRMVGGWDNQRYYYRNVGLAPISADVAIRIGKFLINDELPRYFLNDNTYYGGNAHLKHAPEPELYARLKIRRFKMKFENDDDYEWVGRQFYYITGNQNPFHDGALHGYATWDDGVAFFDWLTNTHRTIPPLLDIPIEYQNPLEVPVNDVPVPRIEPVGIPRGIVNQIRKKYSDVISKNV